MPNTDRVREKLFEAELDVLGPYSRGEAWQFASSPRSERGRLSRSQDTK